MSVAPNELRSLRLHDPRRVGTGEGAVVLLEHEGATAEEDEEFH